MPEESYARMMFSYLRVTARRGKVAEVSSKDFLDKHDLGRLNDQVDVMLFLNHLGKARWEVVGPPTFGGPDEHYLLKRRYFG